MATPDVNQGFQTEWAFELSNAQPSTETFDGSSLAFECVSDTVGVDETITDTAALMGSRWKFEDRSRITSEVVSGQMTFDMSPALLDFFLPVITGDATSAHTPQANGYTDFDFMRSEPATAWLFRNCIVTQAAFRPGPEGLVRMALDVTGRVGTYDGSFANAASQSDIHDEAYSNHEAVINVASGTRYVDNWELVINTGIELITSNSLTPNRARAGEMSCTLNANVEWTSANEAAIYGQGKDGLAATLTFSRENMSTVFTMSTLVLPKSPVGFSNGDNRWNFQGVSKASIGGSTGLYSIAHDSNNAS